MRSNNGTFPNIKSMYHFCRQMTSECKSRLLPRTMRTSYLHQNQYCEIKSILYCGGICWYIHKEYTMSLKLIRTQMNESKDINVSMRIIMAMQKR